MQMPRLTQIKELAGLLHSQGGLDTEGHELDPLKKEDAEGDESESFDQELLMEEDAFVRLKTSIMEDSTIKYYRGCQKSRQTAWRDKGKQIDLLKAATGTALITQFSPSPTLTLQVQHQTNLYWQKQYQRRRKLGRQPLLLELRS